MTYVVAGATSPTGSAVIRRMVERFGAHNITCIARSTSNVDLLNRLGVSMHIGDVTQPESFASLIGPSTIYLDMTHPKHYCHSLAGIMAAGVERAFFVTTTGAFSRYRRCADIYIENEERIRASGVVYTILRPTMIYGTPGDRNMSRLIRFLARWPVFPVFGSGENLVQPVYTDDLAEGIVAAVANPASEYQDYNLAGPLPIPYREMIDTILDSLGRRVVKVRVDPTFAGACVRVLQRLPRFPINDEQVLRMQEDKDFDISKAVNELGYSPRPFEEGIQLEVSAMRAAGLIR